MLAFALQVICHRLLTAVACPVSVRKEHSCVSDSIATYAPTCTCGQLDSASSIASSMLPLYVCSNAFSYP